MVELIACSLSARGPTLNTDTNVVDLLSMIRVPTLVTQLHLAPHAGARHLVHISVLASPKLAQALTEARFSISSARLKLGNPANPKLLTLEVKQVQFLIQLFRGFPRHLPRVCERYRRFG